MHFSGWCINIDSAACKLKEELEEGPGSGELTGGTLPIREGVLQEIGPMSLPWHVCDG